MNNSYISTIMKKELDRQNKGIELIASENYPSKDVLEALGSILTCKYAEGYPGKRYYGGCQYIDQIEQYAMDKACELFHCKYANVQPHSGSQANAAAYRALMPNGGKVLALGLNEGGHLTHGSPVSFSSHLYDFIFYSLGPDGRIDYDKLRDQAKKERPNVILAGFSAYPYTIDWKIFKNIADEIDSYLMVDMAHTAGLIAAGEYSSGNPCDYADIVTSTTHKTLRGPRGGLILTNAPDLSRKINSAVFPYYQGGPLENIIAAKGICFEEALQPEFKSYIKKVIENTKTCMRRLESLGAKTSDTDTHLFLMDTLNSYKLTGLQAQQQLESVGIITNKNMLPNDTLTPKDTSGLRIGFAAATTRGCTKDDAERIGVLIASCLLGLDVSRDEIQQITSRWKSIDNLPSTL